MSSLAQSILLAILLLAGYFVFSRVRRSPNRPSLPGPAAAEFRSLLHSRPSSIQRFHDIQAAVRKVCGIVLVVGLSFFLVGGIHYSNSTYEAAGANAPADLAVAWTGWVAWGLALAVMQSAQGLDALLVGAILGGPLPFTKTDIVTRGTSATALGIGRLAAGIFFLAVALLGACLLAGVCTFF
jgi:hypothetical protein